MRLLITGGTGFIGRFLVPTLLNETAHEVILLLREGYAMGTPLPPALTAVREHYQTVYADLRNLRLTSRAVQRVQPEAVIHLASAGVTNPFLGIDTALRHNLYGTIHLLRACFELNHSTRQCIVARTPGEQTAMNVYAASKVAAWNFCQMFVRTEQWPIHGAMIFQAYGPGQSARNLVPAAISTAQANQDFPMTKGEQTRDWIYVTDVVGGLVKMLGATLPAGKSLDIGSGQATSVADVVRFIYELTGSNGRPKIGQLPERPGEAETQLANSAETAAWIAWQPTTSLREGLRQIISQLTDPQ